MSLRIRPIGIAAAREFVRLVHRHNPETLGGLWACAVEALPREIVGVAIVGRPIARALCDDYTAEVTRVACIEGHRNACSLLYAACTRAARALGYKRLVTYTRASEAGSSIRALSGMGWRRVADVRGRSWSCESRPREDHGAHEDKIRWEVQWEEIPALPDRENAPVAQLALEGL